VTADAGTAESFAVTLIRVPTQKLFGAGRKCVGYYRDARTLPSSQSQRTYSTLPSVWVGPPVMLDAPPRGTRRRVR